MNKKMIRKGYFYLSSLIVAMFAVSLTSCDKNDEETSSEWEFSEISGVDGHFRTPFVYKKTLEYEDATEDGTPVVRPYVCTSYIQYYFPLDSETKVYKYLHHSNKCVAIHQKYDKNFKDVKWFSIKYNGETIDWSIAGTNSENEYSYTINPKQRTITLSNGDVFQVKLRRATNYCIGMTDKDGIEYVKGIYDDEEYNEISYEEWLTNQSKGK